MQNNDNGLSYYVDEIVREKSFKERFKLYILNLVAKVIENNVIYIALPGTPIEYNGRRYYYVRSYKDGKSVNHGYATTLKKALESDAFGGKGSFILNCAPI